MELQPLPGLDLPQKRCLPHKTPSIGPHIMDVQNEYIKDNINHHTTMTLQKKFFFVNTASLKILKPDILS
jgi:hypothetical protein